MPVRSGRRHSAAAAAAARLTFPGPSSPLIVCFALPVRSSQRERGRREGQWQRPAQATTTDMSVGSCCGIARTAASEGSEQTSKREGIDARRAFSRSGDLALSLHPLQLPPLAYPTADPIIHHLLPAGGASAAGRLWFPVRGGAPQGVGISPAGGLAPPGLALAACRAALRRGDGPRHLSARRGLGLARHGAVPRRHAPSGGSFSQPRPESLLC